MCQPDKHVMEFTDSKLERTTLDKRMTDQYPLTAPLGSGEGIASDLFGELPPHDAISWS